MIFIVLGSQKFPFDRLLQSVDKLVSEGKLTGDIFAQRGASSYMPQKFPSEAFMDTERFNQEMNRADIIITHGGTGAIIKAVKLGKKVIVVPRRAQYGEHVDDHQLQIMDMFAGLDLVLPCMEPDQLAEAVEKASSMTFRSYESNTQTIVNDIDGYIQGLMK